MLFPECWYQFNDMQATSRDVDVLVGRALFDTKLRDQLLLQCAEAISNQLVVQPYPHSGLIRTCVERIEWMHAHTIDRCFNIVVLRALRLGRDFLKRL